MGTSVPEQAHLLAKLGLPCLVCGLGLEDHAVPVQFALAEDVDHVVWPVGVALDDVVTATHFERAEF